MSNTELKAAIDELIAKANGNAADYGLTQDLIDEIKADNVTFEADIGNQILKKAEAKASTTKLNGTRKSLDDKVSKAKRRAKDSGVSADKLNEIGFEADDTGLSTGDVQTPTDLLVEGFSNGTNKLRFNRNGNKPNTIFNVEAKIGDAANFVIVGSTSKTTFEHKNQTPGVKVIYRVRAQRGDDFSDYSNPATVYE